MDNALVAAKDRTPTAVRIVYVKGVPVITLGGFYVTTVDSASARAAKTTPSILAQRWVAGLKAALKDKSAVDAYVAQISGTTTATAGTTTTATGSYPYYKQGRVVYIPAGMTIPVTLNSSISSQTARAGDPIEASIAQTVDLGDTSIPQGSTLLGQVTEATAGQKLDKSGLLGIKFTSLRTPDGQEAQIAAHIIGGIGKYQEVGSQSNLLKGESGKDKAKQALIRGAVGAGGGLLLGTTIGAIAHGGRGAGRGAIAGTAIGGALGVAESFLLRKGNDVNVQSGQTFSLLLDAPASLAIASSRSI
jgi:hypothetical protein